MSEELEPCPMCNGEAKRLDLSESYNFPAKVICCTLCATQSAICSRYDAAARMWNTRAANALIDTLVARLIASNYLLKVAVTEGTHDGWMPTAGASINLNEQALAEAKKWKGEA